MRSFAVLQRRYDGAANAITSIKNYSGRAPSHCLDNWISSTNDTVLWRRRAPDRQSASGDGSFRVRPFI